MTAQLVEYTHRTVPRLEHPVWATVALGGGTGLILNLLTAYLICHASSSSLTMGVTLGTLANLLFNSMYYRLVCANRRRAVPGTFARVAGTLLIPPLCGICASLLFNAIPWVGQMGAAAIVLAVSSLFSLVLMRAALVASPELANVHYAEVDEDFYLSQTDAAQVGRIRSWFHNSRFAIVRRAVSRKYVPGMDVADLGCGNCIWNESRIPVTGVDINERMLKWAAADGRLSDYRVSSSLSNTGLASGRYDIVVISEVLEHLPVDEVELTLAEVRRILVTDGVLLATVPSDSFMSPFFVMFNVNCLYQWLVKGSQYHRYRCGHINHFNQRIFRTLLETNGFEVREMVSPNRLTIACIATVS